MKRILILAALVWLCSMFVSAIPSSMLSLSKAYQLCLAQPQTSLNIVTEMRKQQMESQWELDLAQADIYRLSRKYRRAVPLYQKLLSDPQLGDSTVLRMSITLRLMTCYDELRQESDLMIEAYDLLAMSKESKESVFAAIVDFEMGKYQHFHGYNNEGIAKCCAALEVFKGCDYKYKSDILRRVYADLFNMYRKDKRYEEAMQISLLHESEAKKPSGYGVALINERELRKVYAQRATLLAEEGKREEAEAVYALWQHTKGANAIEDKEIIGFLINSGRFDEALGIIHRYKQFLTNEGDRCSEWMVRMLYNESKIYLAKGQQDEASRVLEEAAALSDSLNMMRSKRQMDTTNDLLEQKDLIHQRSQLINALLIVLGGFFIAFLVGFRYSRIIKKRNDTLWKVLNGLDAYRNAAILDQKKQESQKLPIQKAHEVVMNQQAGNEETAADDVCEDEKLFIQMDSIVTRDRLFLNPNLNREHLMRLIGVDKNRFGKMLGRYSDASNVSVYINVKRVEYGAQLLKQFPDYTIATIASECGMSNTVTFNRTFKDVYGVTPSEYRSSQLKKA